ncbi:response regulator [Rhodococcus sp. 1168]|uniref:response regulator n=1 Tax=Rhodococcus sp. 1168 TaxID=2018041 RepID=UPI000A0D1BB6|nr:response regulator [Rhodococcus sp. 1168]ORI25479.1 hypothetical protein BJI47_02150 [Rhodococcus sp. 1168]
MNVLVVEDDRAGRELLGMVLESRGHRVDSYANGQGALLAARVSHPDILIADLMLSSGYTGLDLVIAFRADDGLKSIPILVLTGMSRSAELRLARESGADVCLTKPVDIPQLLSTIEALINP